jgi:polyisoprenoid-binding protein YceI
MVASSIEASAKTETVWRIDPTHSLVEFAVKHMRFATVKGRFAGVGGRIVTDDDDPTRGTVEVDIDAATVDTRDERRDAHLRSGEFFGVDEHPRLTFRSSRVEPGADGSFRVVGDLTIRGVTREVVLDATFNGRGTNPWGQEVAGYSAQTEINRKDYGLEWNAALEGGGFLVGDTVKISLEVEAAKQD